MNHRLCYFLALSGMLLSGISSASDYYVDPLTGNMSNSGTAASPWSTLAAVAAAKMGATPLFFKPGDHIYLRRGDHGTATITDKNAGDVFILPDPGHTPAVRISMINADHWYISGLTILSAVAIDNQTNENSDYDTFENCYLPNGGFSVCGNFTTLRGNHIRNGGIYFLYHSNNGLVSGNTIEDFYSDAMNMKGNYNLFENNLVMNAHKVNGNHNDMFQGWASTGNILRGNEFRAYSDPNQPDLIEPGLSDVQGIGLFDGWYSDWVIENNVLFVDHAIGIWLEGAKGCTVKNNTVVRCGQNIAIAGRPPNIRVAAKKSSTAGVSGAPSVNNVVLNNAAERYEMDPVVDNSGSSVGITMNNVVVAKSAFDTNFLNWGAKDLHLKPGAVTLIDAGTSTNTPPEIDADGDARPFGGAWDCGAFEYGYGITADTAPPTKPTGLTAVVIPGYGVDLHWSASTDNRKVAGYDVFRNGVAVGRTRAGTNYLDITATTTASYTIQAFDHSDNKSAMSDAVGGTPPVPDTQPPTVPAAVTALAQSTSEMVVTWSVSTDNVGVTAYDIYRDGVKVATGSTTSYTDTGLAASTQYSYTVVARDFAGNVSAAGGPAVASTLAPDLIPPTAPGNVTATAMSSGSIQLTWTAATDNRGVVEYEIYRDGVFIDTAEGTSYTDTGLLPLTTYGYVITAMDADGNASVASSPVASATTLQPVPVLVGESFDYAAGSNLNGLNGGSGWGGPWVVGYNSLFPASIETGNPGTMAGLASSGNHLKFWTKGHGNTYQNLDRTFATLIDDGGQTVWLAMVIGLGNSKNAVTWTLTGLTSDAAGTVPATMFATTQDSVPAPFKFVGTTLFSGDASYTPHLVLVKIAMSGDANAETLTGYVDPDLTADPATWTGVTKSLYANGGLIGFAYRGGRASTTTPNTDFQMDEFRIGTTWQAAVGQTVTPPDDTTAPTAPAGLTATALASDSISLVWSAATDNVGVTAYGVYRGAIWIGSTALPAFTDTGLVELTTYSYTVTARDAAGNVSAASSVASATTLAMADTQAPTAPANPSAIALNNASVLITWDPATDNVGITGYDIYRNGALVGSTMTDSFTDTGLAAATAYSYVVKAKDAAGNVSVASVAAAATTQAAVVAATTVLASESFDYAAGNLVGLNGGAGWSGGWTVDSHYDNEAGAYSVADGVIGTYPGLTSVGRNGSFLSGGNGTYYPSAQRLFATPLTDDGGTYWLAFQLQAAAYHKYSSFTLLGTSTPFIYLKDGVAGMNFQFLGGTFYAPGDTNSHLFLIKIQMSGDGNAENASLFYDPDLTADPATWTALRTGTFTMSGGSLTGFRTDSARAGNTGYRTYIDEIRLATTWQGAVGQASSAPIGSWRQAKFGTTADTGNAADDADPNHNGINNLLEYALGGDPNTTTPEAAILPQAARGSGNALQLRFTRYLDRTDINLTVQAADDLAGPWTDLAVSVAGAAFAPGARASESGTGNTRAVTVTDIYQGTDPAHPRRFMRLKVDRW